MKNLTICSDEFIKSQATYFGRLAAGTSPHDHNYGALTQAARMYREERSRRFKAAVARHEIPRMTVLQWQIVDRCIIVPAPRYRGQMYRKLTKEVRT